MGAAGVRGLGDRTVKRSGAHCMDCAQLVEDRREQGKHPLLLDEVATNRVALA
jgi:hypothetical protein